MGGPLVVAAALNGASSLEAEKFNGPWMVPSRCRGVPLAPSGNWTAWTTVADGDRISEHSEHDAVALWPLPQYWLPPKS